MHKNARLPLFIGLVILLSAPWWVLGRLYGGSGYITLMMWSPALAAVLALKLTGGKLSELGWRGAHLGWAAAAILIPAVALSAAYGIGYATGILGFPDADGMATVARATGVPHPGPWAIAWYACIVCTASVVRLTAPSLGEELGWRGLFAPLACGRFGFAGGSLLVGLVWAAWHFPLMFGRNPPIAYANFTLAIIGLSFALSWLRLRTNSVWPAALLHGAHNAINGAFAVLTVETPAKAVWGDETGYLLAGMGICMSAVFWMLGRKLPPQTAPT